MNMERLKKISLTALRFVITTAIFIAFPAAWKALMVFFYQGKMEPISRFWDYPEMMCFLGVFPLLYSLIRQAVIYDAALKERFADSLEKPSISKKLIWMVNLPEFWLKALAFAAIVLFLPFDKSHLAWITSYNNESIAKLLQSFLPFFGIAFVIDILAYLSATAFWITDKDRPPEKMLGAYFTGILHILYIYLPAGFFFGFFAPFAMNFLPLLPEIFTPKTTIICVVLLLILPTYRIIRALRHRRKLMKRIEKLCVKNRFYCTKPYKPYLSALFDYGGESFTISSGNNKYSCKLFCCRKKLTHIRIGADGNADHISSFKIARRFVKTKHFGFESENKKFLIICPTSNIVFAIIGGKPYILDNGDRVGDYTVYSATAFLNALELGVLDKSVKHGSKGYNVEKFGDAPLAAQSARMRTK